MIEAMPDETQRQLLRQVIVARIEGDDEPLAAAAVTAEDDTFDADDSEQLQQFLQGSMEIAPQTAHALAFASDEPVEPEEIEHLAGELRLDAGLLLALAGDASHEVLSHAVTRALAHDKRCATCVQLAAERPSGASLGALREFALRVLSHVQAPDERFADLDELTQSLMDVWGDLDEPGRLRVLAVAVEQVQLRAELSLTDFAHVWYFSHLTMPLRRVVIALMSAPRQTLSVRELLARIPGLASAEPLSLADETRRISRLLAASHARACERLGVDHEQSNMPQIVRPKRHLGQRALRVDPVWHAQMAHIAAIEMGQP